MRAAGVALVVAAAALGVGGAQASTIVFDLSAACVGSCAAGGMSDGDRLRGRVTVDTSGFTPGGAFENAAIHSFRVTFGGRTVSDATAVGFETVGVWGATRRGVDYFSLAAATTTTPFAGLAFGVNSVDGGASTSGSCTDASCQFVVWRDAADLGPLTVAPVPAPPALALALGGLAALGLVARRGAGRRRAVA